MNQDMMKRLTLKASKQITAANYTIIVEIKDKGNEKTLTIYFPANFSPLSSEGILANLKDSLLFHAKQITEWMQKISKAKQDVMKKLEELGQISSYADGYVIKDSTIRVEEILKIKNSDDAKDFQKKVEKKLGPNYFVILK